MVEAGKTMSVLFFMLAGIAVVAAAMMITRRQPRASAICLIVCLLDVAGLFALLGAPLMAALQVLVVVGAVMVLPLIAIMLVDAAGDRSRQRIIGFAQFLGMAAAGYLVCILVLAIWRPPFVESPWSGENFEASTTLAAALLGRYAVPFELAGVMLLAAAVAAAAFVGRRRWL